MIEPVVTEQKVVRTRLNPPTVRQRDSIAMRRQALAEWRLGLCYHLPLTIPGAHLKSLAEPEHIPD
jgi:hypothetical protein